MNAPRSCPKNRSSRSPFVTLAQLNAINGICHLGYDELNRTDSIIVCRDASELAYSDCTLCIETGLPEGIPGCYGGVAYVFVAQLLGFFKSLDCGLTPDAPSVSGNISRVVEGVTLYD